MLTMKPGGCIFLFAAAAVATTFVLTVQATPKKYVAIGWEFNSITIDDLLAHVDQLDATALDGIGFYVNVRRRDGTWMTTRNVMHEPEWNRDDLRPVVEKMKVLTAHRSCRESFASSFFAPNARVSWADDAYWRRVAHNMRESAWLAKQGGCVGVRVDPEDYKKQGQYRRQANEPPYAELVQIVRRRGREVFAPIFEEFPDAKVLFYWLLTLERRYGGGGDLRAAMIAGEDLWPAFVDGIFDVLPSTATLIDGCEWAYRHRASSGDFNRTSVHIRERLVELLSPENRSKYRTQVQVSFGQYLDAYANPPGSKYYFEPLDGSSLKRLDQNLSAATEAASEYVWFWSERNGFVHWADGVQHDKRLVGAPTWEEKMPGLADVMRLIKDPETGLRKWVSDYESGRIAAANENVGCAGAVTNEVPKPYETWQNVQRGAFGWDGVTGCKGEGSLVAQGVTSGCFMTFVRNRKAGERFGVSYAARGGRTSAVVWFLKDGKWDFEQPPVVLSETAGPFSWRKGFGSIKIPDGADGLGVQLDVRLGSEEKAWFDDVAVFPIAYSDK